MDLIVVLIGLVFLVPPVGYAAMVLWRWATWTRVEAKVANVNKDKGRVTLTYVVDGRQRSAAKKAVLLRHTVGDPAVVRYDPSRPFRTQIARPMARTLSMIGLVVPAAAGGGLLIASTVVGPRADENADLPWYVSLGLGLVALTAGIGIGLYQWNRRAWSDAEGTVTSVTTRTSTNNDGGTNETHVVTYRFFDGFSEIPRTATTETFIRNHEKGQSVPVRFDPDDPDRSNLSTLRGRKLGWASAIVLLVSGIVLAVSGFADLIGVDFA